MARQPIKTISSSPEKFIPKSHLNDPTLKEDAGDIKDRPLIFMVRKLSRDAHFKIREMLDFKDDLKPERGLVGSGDVAKYIWENNIIEVKNVVMQDGEAIQCYDSLTGEGKDKLWNTSGMDNEIVEAVLFARNVSEFTEAEAKN